MSELVPVSLAHARKELNLKSPRQTKEGRQWSSWSATQKRRVAVSLETSRLLRSSVPDRIVQPRLVLTLRTKDYGTQEVKCRSTLQGFKDPDVLDLVGDRKTESSTLSTKGRAMTLGDVKSASLVEEKPQGPLYVTIPKSYVKGGLHPDQLFEVRGGYGLGGQPQQWWRPSRSSVPHRTVGFRPASDGSVCVHSERALESLERVARRCVGDPLWRCWSSGKSVWNLGVSR